MRPVQFVIAPISEAQARQMLAWRYDPPYDLYNPDSRHLDEDLRYFLNPVTQMHCIVRREQTELDETTLPSTELIGGCSFGADARVPGADYSTPALDLGIGLRPDLTSHGIGPEVIEAMMAFARAKWGETHFRASIAAFNERSQRAFARSGFHITQHFKAEHNKMPFVVMEKQSGLQSGKVDLADQELDLADQTDLIDPD